MSSNLSRVECASKSKNGQLEKIVYGSTLQRFKAQVNIHEERGWTIASERFNKANLHCVKMIYKRN